MTKRAVAFAGALLAAARSISAHDELTTTTILPAASGSEVSIKGSTFGLEDQAWAFDCFCSTHPAMTPITTASE
jgi:hypothetical protein